MNFQFVDNELGRLNIKQQLEIVAAHNNYTSCSITLTNCSISITYFGWISSYRSCLRTLSCVRCDWYLWHVETSVWIWFVALRYVFGVYRTKFTRFVALSKRERQREEPESVKGKLTFVDNEFHFFFSSWKTRLRMASLWKCYAQNKTLKNVLMISQNFDISRDFLSILSYAYVLIVIERQIEV